MTPNPSNPADPRGPRNILTGAGVVPGIGPAGGAVPKRVLAVRELRSLLADAKHPEVIERFEKLAPRMRDDPELLFLYAMALESVGRIQHALSAGRKSAAKIEHPEPVLLIARCLRIQGETEDALEWCERARRLKPADPTIDFLRAGTLEDAGRVTEASEILAPHAERYVASGEPFHPFLLNEWSKVLVQTKRYDEAIELIDSNTEGRDLPDSVLNPVLYVKAKACDRAKRFDEAFAAAEAANAMGRIEFSPDLYEEQVSTLIENWSRESMAGFPVSACQSRTPVFVAGMPRSGTSLIDQIIDAHPKASGVGELNTIETFATELSRKWDPDKPAGRQFGNFDGRRWTKAADAYVKEITGLAPEGTERVVNKALGNNKLVGLLARLFPKTRIIHAVRDPRDVAISCFMGGFNNRLHAWTTRIEWAAQAWDQSRRMMDHWKATLDVPVLEVNYERLVADPEREFPRIIDFLGLEWDDRCFDFHKSKRTVRTLSYDQVNRPIYTSSSGRHANYAKHIEGVEFPRYDPWAERADD